MLPAVAFAEPDECCPLSIQRKSLLFSTQAASFSVRIVRTLARPGISQHDVVRVLQPIELLHGDFCACPFHLGEIVFARITRNIEPARVAASA